MMRVNELRVRFPFLFLLGPASFVVPSQLGGKRGRGGAPGEPEGTTRLRIVVPVRHTPPPDEWMKMSFRIFHFL